ncbi:sensor histidine kinase [Azospirillum doebereinerae]|uniref:sensor histidine kinase n=1 Tax=Azospirillum doebereinerae TaxID=92933 RepID=UPI001EE5CA31|nr:HWE histidine kinase domain-containing protein [Azospirillum doebereinerae]MCG5243099.1 PAS domain-containing protein [Azospirillum doebereinerae]
MTSMIHEATTDEGVVRCRVLLLEDSPIDADLARAHLDHVDGFSFEIEHVVSRQSFLDALDQGGPFDLILSDFALPDFDGMQALDLVRERLPETPFIFVSGVLGEENAIEALKQGATDYVVKLRMQRLRLVVRRALIEARDRDRLRSAAQALQDSEAQLRYALQAGRLGAWELDLANGRMQVSDICAANLGLSDGRDLSSYETLKACILPDDLPGQQRAVQHAIDAHEDLDVEYRNVWPDGSVHWVQVRGRAVYDRNGTPTRMMGISLDVTERKQAEERQNLLLEELNHRVKNTLAIVQSIAAQTLRSAGSPAAFTEAFQARLRILSQAHDLLTREQWQGALLEEIVGLTLAPYQGAGRVRIGGPPVMLSTGVAVSLHLAFHELATNAAKYGALSVDGGRVEVTWSADGGEGDGEGRTLTLDWRESGGPPVVAPNRRGFGSRMIERALPYELDGDVVLAFAPEGLHCVLAIPLSPRVRLR